MMDKSCDSCVFKDTPKTTVVCQTCRAGGVAGYPHWRGMPVGGPTQEDLIYTPDLLPPDLLGLVRVMPAGDINLRPGGVTYLPEGVTPADVSPEDLASPSEALEYESRKLPDGRLAVRLKDATALNTQVGGSHYKKFAIQPAEFIEKNGLSFLAGCVVKRMCRWQDKDGLRDLEKAKHEIDLLIEIHKLRDKLAEV